MRPSELIARSDLILRTTEVYKSFIMLSLNVSLIIKFIDFKWFFLLILFGSVLSKMLFLCDPFHPHLNDVSQSLLYAPIRVYQSYKKSEQISCKIEFQPPSMIYLNWCNNLNFLC